VDGGQDKAIRLDDYHAIDYGYASTTHKAQGATVDRAYVYGHTKEPMANQHGTYVQISRAREETRIYAVAGERSIERDVGMEPELPGPWDKEQKKEPREKALEELSKTWGREAMKDTTLDFERVQQRMQEQLRQAEQMRQAREERNKQSRSGVEHDIDD